MSQLDLVPLPDRNAWRADIRERLHWVRRLRFRDKDGRLYVTVEWVHKDMFTRKVGLRLIEDALSEFGGHRTTSGSYSEIASVVTWRVFPRPRRWS